jgi:two-component system, OmpR family, sensor histidine kinase CpxA
MKAPWRHSLLAKMLGWLALHLLLLAAAIALFISLQLRVGLDSLLSGRTGERLRDLGETLGQDLRSSPRREWNSILQRHASSLGLQLDLWCPSQEWQSGVFKRIPDNVMARLKDSRLPTGRPPGPMPDRRPSQGARGFPAEMPGRDENPRGGEYAPPPAPGPPAGPDGPQDRMPPSAKPVFFLRGDSGDGYWAAIDVPLTVMRNQNPQQGIILVRSDDLSGNGLFFEVRPWILGALAVIGLSILFWAPFVLAITRYIRRLTTTTERIADGDFNVKLSSGRLDELGRLGSAVADMAFRLDHFVTGQRRFLADVAHELCAPLARLRTGIAVLEPSVPVDRQPRLHAIEEESDELARLIEEILAFSRAGAGQPQLQACELEPLIREIAAREAGSLSVTYDFPDRLVAHADPRLLSRAFGNLIRNARIHAGPSAELRIGGHLVAGMIALSFRDSGPGVAEGELARLFEPFYRPDRSRTRDTGGSGLGLAIVRSCLEACRGRVSVACPITGGLEVNVILVPQSTDDQQID